MKETKRRGRPPTGSAKTDAQRAAEYRARRKAEDNDDFSRGHAALLLLAEFLTLSDSGQAIDAWSTDWTDRVRALFENNVTSQ